METSLHPLVRKHIINGFDNRLLPIVADDDDSSGRRLQLHLNINHISDSEYKFYPEQKGSNNSLYKLYIDFLHLHNASKKHEYVLTEDNISFMSASEAINLIIRVFCEPQKDTICILSPTYTLYSFCAHVNNVSIIDIAQHGADFEYIDVQEILDKNPKVVFIPRPNNPVGSIINIDNILKLLDNFKGLLVIDEAYIEYSDTESLICYVNQYKKNLIIIRSFSKIWGLAGIRCGAIISDALIIKSLESVLTPFILPSHTQNIMKSYLLRRGYIERIKKTNKEQICLLTHELSSLRVVQKVYKSHANFLAVEFTVCEALYQHLIKNNITVRNISRLIPNTLRISLGSAKDNAHLIQMIRNYKI